MSRSCSSEGVHDKALGVVKPRATYCIRQTISLFVLSSIKSSITPIPYILVIVDKTNDILVEGVPANLRGPSYIRQVVSCALDA